MHYLFLEKDIDALREKIAQIERDRIDTAKEASVHVGQSSESWHDNAGFEIALREQMDMAKKASDLRAIMQKTKIVEPSTQTKKAQIGNKITLQNIDTGEDISFTISSYQVLDKKYEDEMSYATPVIEPFINKKIGTKKIINTPGGEKNYELISIELV